MDQKKQFFQKQSVANKSDKNSTFSSAPNAVNASDLDIAIADLLFDLKNLNDKDKNLKIPNLSVLRDKYLADGKFLGIIGICSIPGCDVHTISTQGELLEHFPQGSTLPSAFQDARAALTASPSQVIGALIFDDHFELINLDGSKLR